MHYDIAWGVTMVMSYNHRPAVDYFEQQQERRKRFWKVAMLVAALVVLYIVLH